MTQTNDDTDFARTTRRHRAPTALAVAILLTAAAGCDRPAPDAAVPAGSQPTPGTAAPGARAWTDQFGPGWHDLPGPPIAAGSGGSITWTGTEVVVGGASTTRFPQPDSSEFAAFDPAIGTWRLLPPSPLRIGGDGVWTGAEVLFVDHETKRGRTGGAAWNPATNRWRELVPRPAGSREQTFTGFGGDVWTGEEVVLTGLMAAFDPISNDWRDLAPPPVEAAGYAYHGVWTGNAIVFVSLSRAPTLAFDPRADTWRVTATAPPTNVVGATSDATWNGREVIIADFLGNAAAFDPTSDALRILPDPTGEQDSICNTRAFSLGATAVFGLCSALAILRDDGTWRRDTLASPRWGRTWSPAGDRAAFGWYSDDDTLNNPAAPITEFGVYVLDPPLVRPGRH